MLMVMLMLELGQVVVKCRLKGTHYYTRRSVYSHFDLPSQFSGIVVLSLPLSFYMPMSFLIVEGCAETFLLLHVNFRVRPLGLVFSLGDLISLNCSSVMYMSIRSSVSTSTLRLPRARNSENFLLGLCWCCSSSQKKLACMGVGIGAETGS